MLRTLPGRPELLLRTDGLGGLTEGSAAGPAGPGPTSRRLFSGRKTLAMSGGFRHTRLPWTEQEEPKIGHVSTSDPDTKQGYCS